MPTMAKSMLLVFFIFFVFYIATVPSSANSINNINVLSYGAKPNGVVESTQAFLNAWSAACASTSPAVIYVPKGRYLLASVAFQGGSCRSSHITLRIDGTLVAAGERVYEASNWLGFEGVNGVSVVGGSLDAKGSPLWACKARSSSSSSCPNGAATLSFTNSKNIRISGLMTMNSQFFHIVINGCQSVHVQGVKAIAAGNSPNTDGIHVQFSTNVVIMNSSIKTGDDCISIGPGTSNLWIEGIKCGPGHGISIGSLGRDLEEQGVKNVTVRSTVFMGTTNGFRIKTWAKPSNGYVQGIRFIGAAMYNVQNPIVIDQHYCPHNLDCPNPDQVSGVKISDITYQDIHGSSATPIAINFDCSIKYPCSGIQMQNVKLTYMSSGQPAQSSCANVVGKALGLVQPKANCF